MKKHLKPSQKLAIATESIKSLTAPTLENVAGGTSYPWSVCSGWAMTTTNPKGGKGTAN